jgi:hypothetical protein
MGHFGGTQIVLVNDSFGYRRRDLHSAEANQMAALM